MTEEALETQDESRISRRNALKAAVGAGVGAVAWTGPQITAFGATPAYASGCTNFTFSLTLTDLNTNASTCDSPWQMFQNPSIDSKIKDPRYSTDMGNGQTGVCNDPPDETRYNFLFPEDETCTVTIRMYYSSDAQGNPIPPWAGEAESTGSGGSTPIVWPGYDLPQDTIDNNSLRWAIWIECFKTVDTHCYTATSAAP